MQGRPLTIYFKVITYSCKNGTYFQFLMIKWYSKTSFFPDKNLDGEFFEQMEKRGTNVKCFRQGKEVFSAL